MPVKYLVLDSGPLLSLSPLRGLAETYVTVPQVLDELKDKRAREHFDRLGLSAGVKVLVQSPDPASLAHVIQFAKKTGDYSVLSHADLCVLALTYLLDTREKSAIEKPVGDADDLKAIDGLDQLLHASSLGGKVTDKGWSDLDPLDVEIVPANGDEFPHLSAHPTTEPPPAPENLSIEEPSPTADPSPLEISSASEDQREQARAGIPDTLDVHSAVAHHHHPVETPSEAGITHEKDDKQSQDAVPHSLAQDIPRPHDENTFPTEDVSPQPDPTPIELAAEEEAQELEDTDDGPLYEDPSDEDDGEGEWITPTNVGLHKSRALDMLPSADESKGGKKEEQVLAGCMTADFAMQNVLLQMGLSLVGTEGKRIRKLKTWVLRCHACFKICKDNSKKFCPSCGNPTLMRASVTLASPGADPNTPAMQIHLKKNFQYKNRGTIFSIPAPKFGSAKKGTGEGIILREDQTEYFRARKLAEGKRQREEQRMVKGVMARGTEGVAVGSWMDPDWRPEMISVGTGGKGRTMKNSAWEGDMPKIGTGRKNPNESRRRK